MSRLLKGTGIALLGASQGSVPLPPLPNPPVVYYPFETNLNDISGNAFNMAVISGTGQTFPAAVVGNGLSGVGVTANASPATPFGGTATPKTQNFTLMAWINLNTTSGVHYFGFTSNALSQKGVVVSLTFNSITVAGGAASSFPFSGLSIGSGWHHVAVVGSSGTFSLYLDGTKIGSNTLNGFTNVFGYPEVSNLFGIDEFVAWNSPLTAAQIADLVANPRAVYP